MDYACVFYLTVSQQHIIICPFLQLLPQPFLHLHIIFNKSKNPEPILRTTTSTNQLNNNIIIINSTTTSSSNQLNNNNNIIIIIINSSSSYPKEQSSTPSSFSSTYPEEKKVGKKFKSHDYSSNDCKLVYS